jgi:hypothetical protein
MIPTCSSLEILLAGKAKYKEFQNMMNIYEFDIEHKYTPEKERLQRIKDMYVITNDESFIMYMVNISGYKQTMKLLKLIILLMLEIFCFAIKQGIVGSEMILLFCFATTF